MYGRLGMTAFWGFTAYAFVVRSLRDKLRTGDSGVRGFSQERGPLATVAGVAVTPAWIAIGAAATWRVVSAGTPTRRSVAALGLTTALAGAVLSVASQVALGPSWRIGVADGERTAFVATGPFRWVRNPFFTGMLLLGTGVTIANPSWSGFLGCAALAGSLSVQVRHVEEPHLLETFGREYREYAQRTGRFVPGVGRS